MSKDEMIRDLRHRVTSLETLFNDSEAENRRQAKMMECVEERRDELEAKVADLELTQAQPGPMTDALARANARIRELEAEREKDSDAASEAVKRIGYLESSQANYKAALDGERLRANQLIQDLQEAAERNARQAATIAEMESQVDGLHCNLCLRPDSPNMSGLDAVTVLLEVALERVRKARNGECGNGN